MEIKTYYLSEYIFLPSDLSCWMTAFPFPFFFFGSTRFRTQGLGVGHVPSPFYVSLFFRYRLPFCPVVLENDPPTSVSCVAGITCTSHHTGPYFPSWHLMPPGFPVAIPPASPCFLGPFLPSSYHLNGGGCGMSSIIPPLLLALTSYGSCHQQTLTFPNLSLQLGPFFEHLPLCLMPSEGLSPDVPLLSSGQSAPRGANCLLPKPDFPALFPLLFKVTIIYQVTQNAK
jgi:hypothetical protein